MSTSRRESSSRSEEKNLDVANASRNVWLVKVPKYVAEKWEKAPGDMEVAKLTISRSKATQRQEITLTMSDSLLKLKKENEQAIPGKLKVKVTPMTQQTLGIFSQSTSTSRKKSEKVAMEGTIHQKLECHPIPDETYMRLKLESLRRAQETNHREVKQLDRAVVNFKPVSDHNCNVGYDKRKKDTPKYVSEEKEVVIERLCAAFERHQYYNLKDLVRITRQPAAHLKNILHEVGNYNMRKPHKHMWELKPEYRDYGI